MRKINDFIIYKKDVCKIIDIKEYNDRTFYVLTPIDDDSLTINIPFDNESILFKDIMSKEDAEKLISEIINIKPFEEINDKNIELLYKNAIYNGNHYDLIRVIKTSYIRNDNRIKNNKKASEKDDRYFKLAEKYLYNELSISLNMSFDDTKKYVISMVENK